MVDNIFKFASLRELLGATIHGLSIWFYSVFSPLKEVFPDSDIVGTLWGDMSIFGILLSSAGVSAVLLWLFVKFVLPT